MDEKFYKVGICSNLATVFNEVYLNQWMQRMVREITFLYARQDCNYAHNGLQPHVINAHSFINKHSALKEH